MTLKTIDQVLDLASTLNKIYEADNVTTDIIVSGIEDTDDLKKLARQERGNYFSYEDYYCCAVKLGKINFIITSKN